MKKAILNVAIVLILILSMTACNQKEVVINIDALVTDATAVAGFREQMYEIEEDVIINIYSKLEMNDLEKYRIFVNSTGGKADELALLEAKSEEKAEAVYEAVKERIADLQFAFDGYVPEELKYIENAVVKKEGKYVLFAISQNYDEVSKVFTNYIKGK